MGVSVRWLFVAEKQPARACGVVLLGGMCALLCATSALAQTGVSRRHFAQGQQQPVLSTEFDSAAIQKALQNQSVPSGSPPSARWQALMGGSGVKPAEKTLSGVWLGSGSKTDAQESARVCSVPLLEHRADSGIDKRMLVQIPGTEATASGAARLIDPMAVPPPAPVCPDRQR